MAIRFDLADLQLFLRVAELRNITHGSRAANMSLAAASERIRAMESALGTPLLDRKHNGVALTPAGTTLLRHAHAVLQRIEHMRSDLSAFADGVRGRIRLLTNTIGMLETLPGLLSPFLRTHPTADIDMEERPRTEILHELAAGHADIGVVAGPLEAGSDLVQIPLARNRLALAAPADHRLSREGPIRLADALAYDMLALPRHSELQALVEHHARLSGHPLRIRLRLGSLGAMAQLVADGVGLAIVPETVIRRWQQTQPIACIDLTDPWITSDIIACARDIPTLSPLARALFDHFRTTADPHQGAVPTQASAAIRPPAV